MGRSRYKIYDTREPYFLTCTVVHWLPLFSDPKIAEILLDSLRFLQNEKRLEVFAYVIMENHLHLIAISDDLSKEVGDFKSYTARRIIDELSERNRSYWLRQLKLFKAKHKKDRDYQVWQEGSHPELICDDEMMLQQIEYIHMNPVRRGYVDAPEDWRYSSARNYAGKKGVLEVTTERATPTHIVPTLRVGR
jgi:putative transposase